MTQKRIIPKKLPPGREPTPQYLRSIWATDYIPSWAQPATREAIAGTEARLGVIIPDVLKVQLAVQNGGPVFLKNDRIPFADETRHWTNAIVDGIEKVEAWETAVQNHWFQNATDVPGLKLLVVIAAHSESQFCLDYRSSGPKGMPGVVYIDVSMRPTEVVTVAPSVQEFVAALITSTDPEE